MAAQGAAYSPEGVLRAEQAMSVSHKPGGEQQGSEWAADRFS